MLIQKSFIKDFNLTYSFDSIFGGRVCRTLFETPLGPPLYIIAAHIERFTIEMISIVRATRVELGEIVGRAQPRPGAGLLVGDFNFVNRNCSRLEQIENGPTIIPVEDRDLWAQRRWAATTDALVDYTLDIETHVRHTRARGNTSSSGSSSSSSSSCSSAVGLKKFHGAPLDHTYADLTCWQQLHVVIAVSRVLCPFALFGSGLSDHSPISVKIGMKLSKRRNARPTSINKWILHSKPFREHVYSKCASFVSLGDPFLDIQFYKDTFQDAAKVAGKVLRESKLSSPAAQASAVAASARALHRNDWSGLRRAFRSLPALKTVFSGRGARIVISDIAAYAQLAQTILLKVAHGRLNRAVAQGAAKPRIESLLAKTKLFLPFRRRDSLGAIILPDGSVTND